MDIVGILSITPGSFSGGPYIDPEAAVQRGGDLVAHAQFVGAGGDATRPGPVTLDLAARRRILPGIEVRR